MRIPWTRDEVILGLDVLFSNEISNLAIDNPVILELSEILTLIPISSKIDRDNEYRNPAGVRRQLLTFAWSLKKGRKASHVGQEFYLTYEHFHNNPQDINKVSNAIRRCLAYIPPIPFGDPIEAEGFPEGSILSHFHRYIEARYNDVCKDSLNECEICGLHPKSVYEEVGLNSILSRHLLTAPMDLDPATKVTLIDFITVCPNCHRALHLIRPWRDRSNCENILRV